MTTHYVCVSTVLPAIYKQRMCLNRSMFQYTGDILILNITHTGFAFLSLSILCAVLGEDYFFYYISQECLGGIRIF